MDPLKDRAVPLLQSLDTATTTTPTTHQSTATSTTVLSPFLTLLFNLHLSPQRSLNRQFENLVHAAHLLAATLDVYRTHLPGDALPLLLRHGREALGFEEFYARAFVAEVGFQADKYQRGGGAEVEDFGIPLFRETLSAVISMSCVQERELLCP